MVPRIGLDAMTKRTIPIPCPPARSIATILTELSRFDLYSSHNTTLPVYNGILLDLNNFPFQTGFKLKTILTFR
jgi:hypothetical protein